MTTTGHPHPERIVVGIDGSLASRAAVRWAVDHARPGDKVILVHAWEASPSMDDAELVEADDDSAVRSFAHHELARAQALPHDEAITLSCEAVHGDARECLRRHHGDLLVVGARGHSGLTGMLLGSVSAHLSHHCPVPLVIVHYPGYPADPQAPR